MTAHTTFDRASARMHRHPAPADPTSGTHTWIRFAGIALVVGWLMSLFFTSTLLTM